MSVHIIWKLPQHKNPSAVRRIARENYLPKFVAQIMVNRGIVHRKQVTKFLFPKLSQLDNPFLMHDMKKGVDRINKAIINHEKITIYGDFDADGICSVSIMYLTLKYFGADVHPFIPNRFVDSYGPNMKEYQRIVHDGTSLLITTDNGISGYNEISYAEKHGVDVIITDHHGFPKKLPPAYAIIMAQFPHHHYPNDTNFCGTGIAFKVAQAMFGKIPKKLLDLAAITVISDSMPVTKENRVLEYYGLKEIHHDKRPGLKALAKKAGIDLYGMTSPLLGFTINPRLNALGRLGDANCGVTLLTTHNPKTAQKVAGLIEKRNNRRKRIMHKDLDDAIKQASTPENQKRCTLVIANHNYHPGVVGIVAAQLVSQFHKPTLVIGHLKIDDKKGIDRGSGRSCNGFDLFKAMQPLYEKGYMTSFGGHPYACGFSIKPKDIKALSKGLEKAGQKASLQDITQTVQTEAELSVKDMNIITLRQLDNLQPFGVDNKLPLIDIKVPEIYNERQMGRHNIHLRFTLGENRHSTHVVAWHLGNQLKNIRKNPKYMELAGYIQLNHYNHRTYIQFQMTHMRHYNPDIPTKTECNQTYQLFRKDAPVPYQHFDMDIVAPLSGYFKISVAKAQNILKILQELHLIICNNHKLVVNKHPKSVKLTDSKVYNKLVDDQPVLC